MLQFRERSPKIQYELYTNNTEHIRERLDRGLLDFGLLLEPELSMNSVLVWKKYQPLPSAAGAFLEYLKSIIK